MKSYFLELRLLPAPALTAALALFGLSAVNLMAGEAAAPPPPPPPAPGGIEQFIKESKHPVSWLTWGADFRARNEYFNNALNLGDIDLPAPGGLAVPHEQDYFRFRMRLWASANLATNLSLNARLAAEPRVWMRPAGYTSMRGRSGGDWRYGILDNAYVRYDNAFGVPLTIRAGRQDILLGDFYNWWLVAEGTPGDGSWTFFLDSVRLTYQAPAIKTAFDLVYIYQNHWNDEWIPVFNNQRTALTEQTEQGVIVYGSNKSIENMQIDPYFMYKHDRMDPTQSVSDSAEIFTLGAKFTGTPAEHWQYSVEGAYQLGKKKDKAYQPAPTTYRDIDAFGANASLTYLLRDKLNNRFSVVYEYLSGDDPDTAEDEMFDVLWGRWPRYSELYLYSWALETGKIGQHNNLQRFGPKWSISPGKKTVVSAMYNALFAPEETPTRARIPSRFSRDGNFRGHYLQATLQQKFNPHVSGHLWAEFVWMGDYYTQRDLMSFLRAEVLFTY